MEEFKNKWDNLKEGVRYFIVTASMGLLVGAVLLFNHVHTSKAEQSLSQSQPSNQSPTASVAPSDKDSSGCYTPSNVRNHYRENACVDYKVGYVYRTSAGTKFLDEKTDYSNGFVGYIPYSSNAAGMDINSLNGKNIVITGTIHEYSGYPEIVVSDTSQVKVYTQ